MKVQIFEAADIRSCMKRVRDELGEDAVVLATETDPRSGKVRVSAALDYDDSAARMLAGRQPAHSRAAAASADDDRQLITDAHSFLSKLPEDMRQAMAGSQAGVGQLQAAANSEPPSSPARGLRRLFSGLRGKAPAAAAVSAPPVLTPGTADDVDVTVQLSPSAHAIQQQAIHQQVASELAAEQRSGTQALRAELAAMRRMVERNMQQLTDDRQRSTPSRAAALELLEQFGCAPDLAREIAAEISEHLQREQVLEATAQRFLTRMRLRADDLMANGGIFILVGPTGAGKTTTAAKLAARYAREHAARDVALIAMDQQRAAASEQLQVHGRRLGITVLDAHGIEDLPRVLEQVRGYPLVIVDTAGMGITSNDAVQRLAPLRASHAVQVVTVLPANANPHDLGALLAHIPADMRDAAIITKTDEASRMGAALSVVVSEQVPVAYSGSGQDIHADLQTASAPVLLAQLAQAQARIDADAVATDSVADSGSADRAAA